MNILTIYIFISILFSAAQYLLYPFFILDFVLLLVIEYSVNEKNFKKGIIFSSFIGAVQDIFTGSIFGFNLFAKSLFFYLIFILKDKFFFKNFFIKILFSWIFFCFEIILNFYIFKILLISTTFPGLKNFIIFFIISPFILFFLKFIERYNEV